MSLETYAKQITTWTGINEDVPEHVKYHDLKEEFNKNKEIKGATKICSRTCNPSLDQQNGSNFRKSMVGQGRRKFKML